MTQKELDGLHDAVRRRDVTSLGELGTVAGCLTLMFVAGMWVLSGAILLIARLFGAYQQTHGSLRVSLLPAAIVVSVLALVLVGVVALKQRRRFRHRMQTFPDHPEALDVEWNDRVWCACPCLGPEDVARNTPLNEEHFEELELLVSPGMGEAWILIWREYDGVPPLQSADGRITTTADRFAVLSYDRRGGLSEPPQFELDDATLEELNPYSQEQPVVQVLDESEIPAALRDAVFAAMGD